LEDSRQLGVAACWRDAYVLLIAAWTILPGSAWWTLFALLVLAFPVYAHVTTGLLIHPRAFPGPAILERLGATCDEHVQLVLEIVFLAHRHI